MHASAFRTISKRLRSRTGATVASLALLLAGLSPALQGAPSVGFAEYYILGDDTQIMQALATIPGNLASGTLVSSLTIVASANGVQVYLDEAEDGYDFNPADPVNTADAKWDASTLNVGGNEQGGSLNKGQVLALTQANTFVVGSTGVGGGDRLYITGAPACVVRTCNPTTPGTFMSGSFPLYPIQVWQSSYTAPVGQDVPAAVAGLPAPFVMTDLLVQARVGNTRVVVTAPGGAVLLDTVLAAGQNARVPAINAGTTVVGSDATSGAPALIQAGIITSSGQNNSRYFTLTPDSLLGQEFLLPVQSMTHPQTDDNGRTVNTAAYVIAKENGTTVEIRTATGLQTINLNQNGVYRFPMPRALASTQQAPGGTTAATPVRGFYGASIRTTDSAKKINVYVTADDQRDNVDWGYQGLPIDFALSDYYVPYGPNNPLYMTPVGDNTTFFVDFLSDGTVDQTFTLDRFETNMVYPPIGPGFPPAPYSLAGTRVFATAPFTLVWGQDDTEATPGETNPDLDQGYTILPLFWFDPWLNIDINPNVVSLPASGGPVTFTMTIDTVSNAVYNIDASTLLPANWSYTPGSTTITFTDGSPTITPDPTISGQSLSWALDKDMPPNRRITITFTATAAPGAASGLNLIEATANGTNTVSRTDPAASVLEPTDNTFVTKGGTVTTALQGTISSNASTLTNPSQPITYTMTLTNTGTAPATNVGLLNPQPANTSYVVGSTSVTAPDTTRFSVQDNFDTVAYNNNDGNTPWTTDWIEGNDDGVNSTGSVSIATRNGNTRLRISNRNRTATRGIDLAGATNARISFVRQKDGLDAGGNADQIVVEFSGDSGATWQPATFTYANPNDTNSAAGFVFDSAAIPAAALTANARVRIRTRDIAQSTDTDIVWFDNFQIAWDRRAVETTGGGPTSLLSQGYTLNPGEQMIVSYQARVAQPLNGTPAINEAATGFSSNTNSVPLSISDTLASIGNLVFYDFNRNGIYEPGLGDFPLDDIRVRMTSAGGNGTFGNADDIVWPNVLTTSAPANYGYTGMMPGAYRLSLDPTTIPANTVTTTPTSLDRTLTFGQANTTTNFGIGPDPILMIDLISFTASTSGPNQPVVVSWETGAEIDVAGFHIYRTDATGNPGDRITTDLIPSQGTAGGGASYEFIDELGMAAGDVRWYILEEIETGGVRTFHGPVMVTIGPGATSVEDWRSR